MVYVSDTSRILIRYFHGYISYKTLRLKKTRSQEFSGDVGGLTQGVNQ